MRGSLLPLLKPSLLLSPAFFALKHVKEAVGFSGSADRRPHQGRRDLSMGVLGELGIRSGRGWEWIKDHYYLGYWSLRRILRRWNGDVILRALVDNNLAHLTDDRGGGLGRTRNFGIREDLAPLGCMRRNNHCLPPPHRGKETKCNPLLYIHGFEFDSSVSSVFRTWSF